MTDERPAISGPITLELDSLTLGEMAAAEEASGLSIDALIRRGKGHRLMLAAFVAYRRAGEPLTWAEVGALRLSDARSSSSR